MSPRVDPRSLGYVALFAFLGMLSVRGAQAQTPPCGPNHSIPPGYGTCKDSTGRTWVGPPPARAGANTAVPPPSGSRIGGAVSAPETANGGVTPSSYQAQPEASKRSSTWFTVAGITAIAALIAAITGLVRAFRKSS